MTDFNFTQRRLEPPIALEIDFNFGASVYRLLEGQSNIMTAIWADADAGRTSGKMYVASAGVGAALSVLDLKLMLLYDRYTTELRGRANELLAQEDPKDIIV